MSTRVYAIVIGVLIVTVAVVAGVQHTNMTTGNNTSVSTPDLGNESSLTENESGLELSVNISNTTSGNNTTANQTGNNVTDNLTDINETVNETEDEQTTELNVSINASTAILSSADDYPDMFVATTAGEKSGYPVLLTANDSLSADTRNMLAAIDPENIVVVGGPQAVSTNVSTSLEAEYNVTRLWGFTRYGTAVEVAEYFWPEGSDDAVIVQNDRDDEDYRTVARAAEIAQLDRNPLYLTPTASVPAVTSASLDQLRVRDAVLIGTNMSDTFFAPLEDGDIMVDEGFSADNTTALDQQLETALRDELPMTDKVAVVSDDDYRYAAVAANMPETIVQFATNENQTDSVLTVLNETTIENVSVVGTETRGETIMTQLEEQGFTTDSYLGPVEDIVEINNRVVIDQASAFEAAARENLMEIERLIEQDEQEVRDRVARLIVQTERLVTNETEQSTRELLTGAAVDFQDDEYVSALQNTMRAKSMMRMQRFGTAVETALFDELITAELRTIAELEEQMRDINPVLGTGFAETSAETRFWIVDAVHELTNEETNLLLRETASAFEEDGDLLTEFERARDRIDAGNLTVNTTNGNSTEPGENITNQTNQTVDGQNESNTVENETAVQSQEIALADNAFEPAQITANDGDRLVFVNEGQNLHNVNIPGLNVDQDVEPGDQLTVELDQNGIFNLSCDYHQPEMVGEITVQ